MSTTKQCTKCGEVKALDTFSASKRGKHGRRAYCKNCERKYRQENKERIAERVGKCQKENPEVGRRAQRKRRALLRNLPHQPLTPQQYEILHRQKYEIFGGIANEH